MNRDEAIAIIRKEYLCVDRDCDIGRSCGKCDLMMPSKEPILEAYKMAIKALEQMPTKEEEALLQKWRDNRGISMEEFEDAMNTLDQEPCEDAISRAEAVRVASGYCHPANVAKELAKLPAVTPQPKTGHWIGIDGKPSHLQDGMTTGSAWCSECGKWLTASDEYSCFGNYCPNCGSRMVEPQERRGIKE